MLGHSMLTLEHWNSFTLAMLKGTVDLYILMPLSVALTLHESHRVSGKLHLLALFSHTLLS